MVACDSVGGIGPKEHDVYPTDATTLASFATRVPLLELMCVGAKPVAIVNCLCVEKDPMGNEMISTIRTMARQAGIDPHKVTGSTEDNVATVASGIGVTILGDLGSRDLPRAKPGDELWCLGAPVSAPGDDLYQGHPSMIGIDEVYALMRSGLIHDAVPAGSHGIAHEFDEIIARCGLDFTRTDISIDLHKSAGPASCILACFSSSDRIRVLSMIDDKRPRYLLGVFLENS